MSRRIEQDVTLTILAGGAGSRMRRPKAELHINDCPILRYLLARFAWRGPTLLVTAPGREHPAACDDFDREVVDPVPGIGPLRGVLTAIEHTETELVVVATVDMPLISRDQLRWLRSVARDERDLLGVMIRRTTAQGSRVEPFPSIFRREAAHTIAHRLAGDDCSVHGLTQLPGFVARRAPQGWTETSWLNLNTPDDLAAFLKLIENDSVDPQLSPQVSPEDHPAI